MIFCDRVTRKPTIRKPRVRAERRSIMVLLNIKRVFPVVRWVQVFSDGQ